MKWTLLDTGESGSPDTAIDRSSAVSVCRRHGVARRSPARGKRTCRAARPAANRCSGCRPPAARWRPVPLCCRPPTCAPGSPQPSPLRPPLALVNLPRARSRLCPAPGLRRCRLAVGSGRSGRLWPAPAPGAYVRPLSRRLRRWLPAARHSLRPSRWPLMRRTPSRALPQPVGLARRRGKTVVISMTPKPRRTCPGRRNACAAEADSSRRSRDVPWSSATSAPTMPRKTPVSGATL